MTIAFLRPTMKRSRHPAIPIVLALLLGGAGSATAAPEPVDLMAPGPVAQSPAPVAPPLVLQPSLPARSAKKPNLVGSGRPTGSAVETSAVAAPAPMVVPSGALAEPGPGRAPAKVAAVKRVKTRPAASKTAADTKPVAPAVLPAAPLAPPVAEPPAPQQQAVPAPAPVPPAKPAQMAAAAPSEAQQYCSSIAAAAIDAQAAWQATRLIELDQQLKQRIAELEAKRTEYKDWLGRREEALRKAEDGLVAIYSRMRPDAAALQLSAMEDDTAAAVLTKLNSRSASAILNEMEAGRAARLTGAMAGLAGSGRDRKKS